MKSCNRIAEFVSSYPVQAMPEEAVNLAKSGILDYVGVVLAGVDEKSATLVRQLAHSMGGNLQAAIWGTGTRTSVSLASLANGTAAHALDYDDTNPVMLAHPSIQLLPGLFALGEYRHTSGFEILTAYMVGFEVGATLGRVLNPAHAAQGWLPIGTLGPLMQAAACARLLGLSSDLTLMALSIATNLASGLRCNNGTMAKHLLAGHAASSGVLAAVLAGDGLNANPKALEDQFGFMENFSRGNSIGLEQEVDRLGDYLNIIESGLSFKLYPCCAAAHGAIDCALEIAGKHSPRPDMIKSIEVSVHRAVKIALIHARPKNAAEARFSLEYCVCRSLLDHQLGPEQFQSDKIGDDILQELIAKVQPAYHDRPVTEDDLKQSRFPVALKVHMKDGSVLSSRVEYAKGTPKNPVLPADLENKFRLCCSQKLSTRQINDVLHLLNHFEQVEDIDKLIAMIN